MQYAETKQSALKKIQGTPWLLQILQISQYSHSPIQELKSANLEGGTSVTPC